MRFGQPRHLWAADPNRPTEDALRIIGYPLQFSAAAGQHDLAAERTRKAEVLERRGDFAGEMLETLPDDSDQLRTRDARGLGAVLTAGDRGELNHVVIVAWRGGRRPVK